MSENQGLILARRISESLAEYENWERRVGKAKERDENNELADAILVLLNEGALQFEVDEDVNMCEVRNLTNKPVRYYESQRGYEIRITVRCGDPTAIANVLMKRFRGGNRV